MKTKRIAYFDIAKFIAMMMVVLGHFGVPDINRFVYIFHIPLFFLISGFFFKPYKQTAELVKIKFRQLIIPYLLVAVSVIFIFIVSNLWHQVSFSVLMQGILNYAFGFLYGSGYIDYVFGFKITEIGPIWFCLALFFGFIFLNLLLKTKYPAVGVLLVFLAGYYSSKFFWLPLSIQSAMTAVLFIFIGYKAKQYNIMNFRPHAGNLIPLFCICLMGLSYGSQFLFVHNYSVYLATDIITALAASYLVLLYCRWLEENVQAHFIQSMAFLGRYTIVMLCIHSVDVLILPWNDYYKVANTSSSIIVIKLLITLLKFSLPPLGAFCVSKSLRLKKFFMIKD